ncbi:hypothetical protein N6741_24240, partial [Klebsiella pneumoniae]|uniref:hypothetical protein n=1 Tax=Klebsiella pneumoniae TaxID=573 RepID=UPI0021BFFF46
LERWIKGSAILGCVGCLVGHLFMFLVGGKTPDQSVHLNLTTTQDMQCCRGFSHDCALSELG